MKLKSKFGMGVKRKTKSKFGAGARRKKKHGRTTKRKSKAKRTTKRKIKSKRKSRLADVIKAAKKSMKPGKLSRSVIQSALKGARDAVKKIGGKSKVMTPRILPLSSKIGGYLPFLIPLFAGLSATGALAGGAAGIAKAVNDAKAAREQLRESKRHNESMEAIAIGKGLYLKPHKTGLGLHLKPYDGRGLKKKFDIALPDRALSNTDLIRYAAELKIPHFRGVFMRNELPASGPRYRESAIVNLDDASGPGTHWVAYRKCGGNVVYFDSFGDLQPPTDLMFYLKVDQVKYNHKRYQNFNEYNCGHLCLKFLCKAI